MNEKTSIQFAHIGKQIAYVWFCLFAMKNCNSVNCMPHCSIHLYRKISELQQQGYLLKTNYSAELIVQGANWQTGKTAKQTSKQTTWQIEFSAAFKTKIGSYPVRAANILNENKRVSTHPSAPQIPEQVNILLSYQLKIKPIWIKISFLSFPKDSARK